jgi:CMP-N,N'-diacetyllegionaminic acid synthase
MASVKDLKVLCIIPARSGSKTFPHKNIADFCGKPLIAWSIEHALHCKVPMRVVVSTDSEEYARIAREYGAETPFLRPVPISGDLSTDQECIEHCLKELYEKEGYEPDLLVQLRPTYPTRRVETLNDCLDTFLANYTDYDSLRTVVPFEKSPYKMYRIQNAVLTPLFLEVDGLEEPYNRCRQELPQAYLHNGCIDIFKAELLSRNPPTITGARIYPYIMDSQETHDVDTVDDLKKCSSR